MRITKDIRRIAFQTLYQLDARNGEHRDEIRAAQAGGLRAEGGRGGVADAKALDAAWALAEGAWEHREAADRELALLAPEWPTHRLAAVDRAILRLAHFEMAPLLTEGGVPGESMTPPKVVVNDAVNLAKEFSTDRAPAFINGLLDKVLKRVLGARAAAAPEEEAAAPPRPAPSPPGEGSEPVAKSLGEHEIPG